MLLTPALRGITHSTGGVPEFITVNGVVGRLLIGDDGQPLTGDDGYYLYGAV